jgi:hypothetical protein
VLEEELARVEPQRPDEAQLIGNVQPS